MIEFPRPHRPYLKRHACRKRRCHVCRVIDHQGSGMWFNSGWHCWECSVRLLAKRA